MEQKAINFNGTSYSEDTRGNKSAKNGAEYTEEGIYIISVQHDYNNSRTTDKTIFVGSSPIIKALSRNNITINDINNLLAQGYKIDNDGGLVSNTGDELETEEEETPSEIEEPVSTDNTVDETPEPIVKEETKTAKTINPLPIGVAVIVALVGVIAFIVKSRKRKSLMADVSDEEQETDIQEDDSKEEE